MKKYYILFLLLFGGLSTSYGQLSLPQASPREHITQTIGLTTVDLDFGRPGVKGRQIFGSLLPYDSVWRIGANAATTIEISDDISLGGQLLKKGKYALFARPGKKEWTILVNSNPNVWGTDYRRSETIKWIKAWPSVTAFTETMVMNIDSIRNDSANLIIQWEKTRVAIPMVFPTEKKVTANINAITKNGWRSYAQIANYILNNRGDIQEALKQVNISIALQENYDNDWIKAQILAKQGQYKEALAWVDKAIKLGEGSAPDSSYKEFAPRMAKAAQEYAAKQ